MAKRAALAVVSPAAGIEQAKAQLNAIRERVTALRADLELEANRPVPLAVIEARVEQTVAVLREQAEQALLEGELLVPNGGHVGHELARRPTPAFAVAALLAPDALRAWMRQRAESALVTLPEPVDAQERQRRVRELTTALCAAERDEARLIWAASDAGVSLTWRPDHDPAAVLGLDE